MAKVIVIKDDGSVIDATDCLALALSDWRWSDPCPQCGTPLLTTKHTGDEMDGRGCIACPWSEYDPLGLKEEAKS